MLGSPSPSMEPMLITRAGSAGLAAARSSGSERTVSSNSALMFTFQSLSKASSGYSSSGAPHVAPALLTRTSSWSSRSLMKRISSSTPPGAARFNEIEMQSPKKDSSAPYASQASFFRALIQTQQHDLT